LYNDYAIICVGWSILVGSLVLRRLRFILSISDRVENIFSMKSQVELSKSHVMWSCIVSNFFDWVNKYDRGRRSWVCSGCSRIPYQFFFLEIWLDLVKFRQNLDKSD